MVQGYDHRDERCHWSSQLSRYIVVAFGGNERSIGIFLSAAFADRPPEGYTGP